MTRQTFDSETEKRLKKLEEIMYSDYYVSSDPIQASELIYQWVKNGNFSLKEFREALKILGVKGLS